MEFANNEGFARVFSYVEPVKMFDPMKLLISYITEEKDFD